MATTDTNLSEMDVETDDISLPTLPPNEPSLPSVPSLQHLTSRKRPFLRSREPSSFDDQLAEAVHTSSDPALFSSDETPDAENYSPGAKRQKKKTYEGTWWGEKLHKSRGSRRSSRLGAGKKREFRRNFDSGIFMGSDSSASELSSGSSLEQELLDAQEGKLPNILAQNARAFGLTNPPASVHTPQRRRSFKFVVRPDPKQVSTTVCVDAKHKHAAEIVQECLRKNDENVDLTGLGLDSLPASITDLKSMIKRIAHVPDDTKLAPFAAEVRVFLGNNDFSQLPAPLLELTNIQLLSLRQNKLVEIPPGIRNLTELTELNISSNRLESLPFEVLDLLQHNSLRVVQSLPNPWLPLPIDSDCLTDVPMPQMLTRSMAFLRRVAVGKPVSQLPNGSQHPLSSATPPSGRAPSLSETVLRALLKHNKMKTDLSSLLTEYDPDSLRRLLTTLHKVQSSGGRQCTFCRRPMVTPQSQWTEWWDVSSQVMHTETLPEDFALGDERINALVYTQDREPETADPFLEDRLLPFVRMSCGCRDVGEGLESESEALRRYGHEVEAGMYKVMMDSRSWALDVSGGKIKVVLVDRT